MITRSYVPSDNAARIASRGSPLVPVRPSTRPPAREKKQRQRQFYRRLQAAFRRVFASTIFFGTREELREAQVWDCSRGHSLDHMQLWFGREGSIAGDRQTTTATLSPAFWDELSSHPIPVDTEVVRALANNPGCLDLYTWLTWRCYQAKDTQRIPLFGPMGLANQLGVRGICAGSENCRERIRQWLELVRLCWPACPASVTKNGAFLELRPGIALRPSRT